MNKTFWQWTALIAYLIGLAANIAAWVTLHTDAWKYCMLTTALTWALAVWCVFFKPGRTGAS